MKHTTFEEIRETITAMILVMKAAETREVITRAYTRIDGAINAFSITGLLTIEEDRELTKLNNDSMQEMFRLIKE